MFRRWAALVGVVTVWVVLIAQLSLTTLLLVQRAMVRHEMERLVLQGLPGSELTVLRFTPAALRTVSFEDGGRELVHEGHWYDIVRTYSLADGVVVYEAVRDDRESVLMARLGREVERCVATSRAARGTRSVLLNVWAVYCEPWPIGGSAHDRACELSFGDLSVGTGRCREAAEPGPPRRG